jgi:hypothetical protein
MLAPMSSDMPAGPPAGASAVPDDLRSDALDILSDALQWRLPAARWESVEKVAQALRDAVRAGDLEELEAALGDLELAAPLRITPLGGEETTPATPGLRNIARDVVHDLGQGIGPDARVSAGDQRDRDDASDATGC